MKIILVNRWYPPYTGFGGVAAYNYYLAHALVKQGHQVIVIAARWSRNVPKVQDDQGVIVYRLLLEHRARLQRLPVIGRYMRALEQYIYSYRIAEKIQDLDRLNKFDVVEFAEVNAEGFHYLKRRERCPVVVRCHTPSFVLQKYYSPSEMPYDVSWTEKMEKFCIKAADSLTAPSNDMVNIITQSFTDKALSIDVVPNPLDTQLFFAKQRPENLVNIKILHVGRLDRVKGIEVLLQAIPIVISKFPKSRFIFVGDGPTEYLSYLQKQLAQLGIQNDQIVFTGAIGQDELIRQYQDADIAVVPTLNYESFSYTCAQAMAMSLPLVASKIGGIAETVGTKGAAILINPGDVDALADAIIGLAENLKLRRKMSLAGRERAEKYFDSAIVAAQMLDLYSKVS